MRAESGVMVLFWFSHFFVISFAHVFRFSFGQIQNTNFFGFIQVIFTDLGNICCEVV
jgi:hypothetical protein